MSGRPVRVAIASPDRLVEQGLRRMLAQQAHRVVVVEETSRLVDVVLHDGPADETPDSQLRRTGAAWVPLQVGVEQIVMMVEAAAHPSAAGAEAVGLTGREVQVLALIAEGLTNQEIADRVYISINSVKTYIRAAYRKVGVNSRSQAAIWAMQHGIVRRD
ncbi:response regulator transcription factor [Nocardioides conyzicola]|uniref:response regulator transcription factor n=1 Tax=Nocardioides conyzicola TaxID=1651781 RepID=UPI0031EE3D9C